MEKMTRGPVIVIEVPDVGGKGHRFLVPEGARITESGAASLVASIRGPIHVAADRLGLARHTTQRTTQGTTRDGSTVVAVSGIDVSNATPRQVLSALATLEASLDAVNAEACDTLASAATMVNESPVLTRALESIHSLGFHEQTPNADAVQHVPTALTPPTPTKPVEEMPLLVGTLAVLACGVGIGWMVAMLNHGEHVYGSVATAVAHEAQPRKSSAEPSTGPMPARFGDDTDVPAESSGPPTSDHGHETLDGDQVQNDVKVPPSQGENGAPGQEIEAGHRIRASTPTVASNASVVFVLECIGVEDGDRVQLFRRGNDRSIGQEHLVDAKHRSFTERAPEGITHPDQLSIGFTTVKPGRFSPTPKCEYCDPVRDDTIGKHTCTFDVMNSRGEVVRRVSINLGLLPTNE